MALILIDPPHVEASEQHPAAGGLLKQRVRAALWLTLIFWGSNFLLLTLGTALAGNPHLLAITGMLFLAMLLGLFFCYLIHLLLRRLSTTRKRLIALAITAPIAAETFAWAVFFAEAAVDPALDVHNFSWSVAVRTVSFWTWYFLAWSGLYLAQSYSFDVQEQQQRTAELRELAHVAQLRALHSRINPHFLFNSLNSVSALILDRETEKADEMVTKLAQLLRLGLAADPMEKITLEAELRLQQIYLEIEQLRYEDLKFLFDVDDELLTATVPALILQPIVENAVKYGVVTAPPPGRINVKGSRTGRQLNLEVTDTGKAAPQNAGTGIGLAHVLQRLRLIYGEEQVSLEAGRMPEGGFRVALSLPLEFA